LKSVSAALKPEGYGTRPSFLSSGTRVEFSALTVSKRVSKLTVMVVHLKPETESRLKELAATTGRAPEDLVEDAMSGYLAELTEVRKTLDSRYDDIKSGRVAPIDGEEAFARLRQISQDRRRA
jgi:predicted transcriptional regulator